jgi:hypothetical protein
MYLWPSSKIELEFRNVDFSREPENLELRRTGEPREPENLEARRESTTNSTHNMTPSPGIEPGATVVRGERSHRYATHASLYLSLTPSK